MKKSNILITSVGRRVSLVKLFQEAFQILKIDGLVYAVDKLAHAPALQVADKSQTIVGIESPKYIERLLEFCLMNDIKLVVPTIDTELKILSMRQDLFAQKGIKIIISSTEVIEICMDKLKTQHFFHEHNIPTPESYSFEEAMQIVSEEFPLLLKPVNGSSSHGVHVIKNIEELSFFYKHSNSVLIQKFIEGKEFTIDVFTDFNGDVRCAVPRLRVETRSGEVSKAITVKDNEIIKWCYDIVSLLDNGVGCLTLQCIKNSEGQLKFIEINPRFGGGFPLSSEAGAFYPLWILQLQNGIKLDSNLQNKWREGLAMLRYDEPLYIDRDKVQL